MRKILIILAIFILSGCALSKSHIIYPQLRPLEGLSILEKGYYFQSCILKQKNIINSYKITRKNYTLYIVLGNKHSPEIYLGAKDNQNNPLDIKVSNLSQDDFFVNLPQNQQLDKEKIKKYALSKLYTTRVLFDEKSKQESINSFGPLTLEIYNFQKQKIANIKLEFDLKSFDCKSIKAL